MCEKDFQDIVSHFLTDPDLRFTASTEQRNSDLLSFTCIFLNKVHKSWPMQFSDHDTLNQLGLASKQIIKVQNTLGLKMKRAVRFFDEER